MQAQASGDKAKIRQAYVPALRTQLLASPGEVLSQLSVEMAAQTPQGAMGAANLGLQVLVACVALHIVLDVPQRGKDGELWGPLD